MMEMEISKINHLLHMYLLIMVIMNLMLKIKHMSKGKRYENLFYCKRSLGTANENPGNPRLEKIIKK